MHITKRLRRIHNAWHFWFVSTYVFTAQWLGLGGRVVHHLTRRYVLRGKNGILYKKNRESPSRIFSFKP
ncbi:hypothetical protein D5E72_24605 [Vibrio parahaemolyticus]|nr:hypothetical protein D5E73_24740 [Vibrio parahaemolyticus]TBT71000.1 hypothetical protein D5E72_24605 [Vibrio parahaemolyticus]